MLFRLTCLLLCVLSSFSPLSAQSLKLIRKIGGNIAPKSVVHNGNGLFFAQNMMYRHSITVYNRDFQLVQTISDKVNLAEYNIPGYTGQHAGAPVECAFSPDGRYAWISNYAMSGKGFDTPGDDDCLKDPQEWDYSFVYKINTSTFRVENVVKVGSVPKFAATTPDGRYVLVSNWCSSDLSVIDAATSTEVRRIPLGRYPRGIAVDPQSLRAYVCLMGSNRLAVIDFCDWVVHPLEVGNGPRHICLSPDGRFAYVTLNTDDQVVKVDLRAEAVVAKTAGGDAPRSACIDGTGQFLYVVQYKDNKLAKYRCADLSAVETVKTADKPIGVTYDVARQTVWVACYTGAIWVFSDENATLQVPGKQPVSPPTTRTIARAEPRQEPQPTAPLPTKSATKPEKPATEPVPQKPATVAATKPAKPTPAPVATKPAATPAKPATAPAKKPEPAPAKKLPYTIVVGSFSSPANAQKRQKELIVKGLQAEVRGNRVCVGAYATEAEAAKAVKALAKSHALEGWVLKK